MKFKLDKDQEKIVSWEEGPVLVNAGPGSGKTRVITERIDRLADKYDPRSILAVTFTKKATEEMENRLSHRRDAKLITIKTTHAYAWGLLRNHPRFRTWEIDEKEFAKTSLKIILGHTLMKWRVDISLVEQFIATARAALLSPEEAGKKLAGVTSPLFFEAYHHYHEKLAGAQVLTFDDMLYYGVRLLQEDKSLRALQQARYKFVIVDEAQDCNYAQTQLVQIVAKPENNLMLVGDVDQAIYAWRGAQPEYLLSFPSEYNATTLELGHNYRCPKEIVEKASKLIEHNERRFSKSLTAADRSADISVIYPENSDDEARSIGEHIQSSGVAWRDNAILLRTNAQSRAYEEVFPTMRIPFTIWGEGGFYQRKEIQDLLAYLKLVVTPGDTTAGSRAINRPFRYIGNVHLSELVRITQREGSYIEAVRELIDRGGPRGLTDFADLYAEPIESPGEFLRFIVTRTGYVEYLQMNEGSDTPETSRANNVQELIVSASRFGTIPEFVAYVDQQIERRKKMRKLKDAVQIMTIHRAKGTEFESVYLVGANEGLIPHKNGEIEEERRLAYVALTRAKRVLVLSAISSETSNAGEITPFAYESGIIPEEPLD